MEENKYVQYVRNPGVFWHSLQRWAQILVNLIGIAVGLLIWSGGIAASFLFMALIFMSTAAAANFAKIIILVVVVTTFFVIPIFTAWLSRLAAYLIGRSIVMADENVSILDSIFKKE